MNLRNAGRTGFRVRRATIAALAGIVVAVVAANGPDEGAVDGARVALADSAQFSSEEVGDAADTVLEAFKSKTACRLTDLTFDDASSGAGVQAYLTYGGGSDGGVTADNVIVLVSSFTVGADGADQSLNAGSVYDGWQWILVRDGPGTPWRVADQGVG